MLKKNDFYQNVNSCGFKANISNIFKNIINNYYQKSSDLNGPSFLESRVIFIIHMRIDYVPIFH